MQIDEHRVAVFPFRVTAADSLLGEGFAELIAMELAERPDARPVHMGSLLTAWRGAGGGLRAPLALQQAQRIGRKLGAGRFVDGSVIATGSRLTIASSLVSVTDGRSTPIEPVRGHVDSLESLARRVSVAVLTAMGAEPRAAAAYRLTSSPVALQAYLDGLRAWRRRNYATADSAFERAIEVDSTFASAAFARLRSGQYTYQPTSRWARLALRYRDRLSAEERAILDAILGENYPASRTYQQQLRALEALAQRYPESAEANYHLGDFLVHFGRAMGVANADRRSLELLERSVALDTQSTVFGHLLGIATQVGDSALLRRTWRGYVAFEDDPDPRIGFLIGARIGDARMMNRFARVPAGYSYFMIFAAHYGMSASVIDSMFALSRLGAARAPATWLAFANAALLQGRPDDAVQALMQWPVDDSTAILRDALIIAAAVSADGDSVAADAAYERLASTHPSTNTERARAQCASALWDEHRRVESRADETFLIHNRFANCATILSLLGARRLSILTPETLLAADSLLGERLGLNQYAGIESTVLARLWADMGDTTRALSAARRAHDGYPVIAGIGGSGTSLSLATSALLEGRFAEALGDNVAALDAYGRYLAMRHSPEPRLITQRDSVRASVARLRREPSIDARRP